MLIRKIAKIFVILLLTFLITLILYSKYFKKEEISDQKKIIIKENVYKSNIIKDVNYTTKDADGNEYSINAKQAEIDLSDTNILFLTDVKAFIKLRNSEIISITSDYGKYNADNFDTIFSKNVLINYLDNKINGEYLDFSYERNSMIISKKVVFTNIENILEADVIEINIKTKDTKIFMYEKEKKVNIKSKNLNGNN
jgi:LPS export ABC transporter protein LptC